MRKKNIILTAVLVIAVAGAASYAGCSQSAAVIKVIEEIKVSDAVGILPAAIIEVIENISVSDAVDILPAAVIEVIENVGT